MRQLLYIAMLLFIATVHTPCAAQQPQPLIDTVRINAMRDSAGKRLSQVFDVDMLSKCLQVKQIENIRSLSLLKLNQPLKDTIEAFFEGYGTNILVHSFINSEQFWPRLLFNPTRLSKDISNSTKNPAVGFDVSFTPYGVGSTRKFAIEINNQTTAKLLSDAQLTKLKNETKKGIKGQFRKLSPDGKDSVNASLFRGIATLRDYWEKELSKCNIQKVTFAPTAKPSYGFDIEPNETMKSFYESLVLSGRGYNVPWKSIEAGKTEDVIARISLKDSNPATHKVNFRRDKAGPPMVKDNGDGTYTLTLTGGSNKDEEIIEVFYTDTLPGGKTKETVVGEIKVKTYSPTQSKIVPVLLNGASYSENSTTLKTALDNIYKQAAVSWTVAEPISISVDQNTWDVDEKDGILLIETSPLHRYSKEMQAIIDKIKDLPTYDSEASYAVITDLPNSEGYAGYMPLKSDFAFIFTKSNGDLKKIIPHEMGHGAFYLKHPQDEYHILDATDNLMDKYSVGTTLWKPQWDWIGDPSWRLYAFQEESDGASAICNHYFNLSYNDCTKKGLTIGGEVYQVPFVQEYKGIGSCNPKYFYILEYSAQLNSGYDENGNPKKVPVPIELNSPMSLKNFTKISSDKLWELPGGYATTINFKKDIVSSDIYLNKVRNWKREHWQASTEARLQSYFNVQDLAKAILKGGELDLSSIVSVDPNTLYSEISNENGISQVYYNNEEIQYYYWGYICTGHDGLNFYSFDEAAAFAIQFLGKDKLSGKINDKLEEVPWKVKAIRDGWISAYTNNGTNTKILDFINMYQPYRVDASYLIKGITPADMIEVSLWVFTGSVASSSIKKVTVKVGTKMLTSAFINWQVNILVNMIGGMTYNEAVRNVDYSDVIWEGITSVIKNENLGGTLDCMNAMVDKFEKSKELNYTTGTDMAFACLLELGKSKIFETIIKDANSPYSKILKGLFKNKKMSDIRQLIMNNLHCTYQDTYDIMRLIPAQILDTLIKD